MQRITVNNPQNVIDGTAKKYYFKLRQTGGPKGDKGDKGDKGSRGPKGEPGNAATVYVGSTTTLEVGQDATVENVGTQYNAVLNFGIPQGPRGPQGIQGERGEPGSRGETGPRGPQGERGTNATVYIGTTTTGEPGTQASVYNSGTESNAVLNFTIPRGDVGPSVPLVQETGNSTTKAMSQNATTEALNGKQNTLTAGSNITISGNTISATDTTYTAGDNVQINGTVISATDTTYTAGANIQIENGTISATDTTYTAGNGLNLNGTEFSADTDVLATKADLENYYTKPEADNLLSPKLEAEVVAELPTTGEEGKLYLTPKAHTTQTATGNPITATVAEEAGAIESFQLDGDTFQQSYEGKNLFDFDSWKGASWTIAGVTWTPNADQSVTSEGTSTSSHSGCYFEFRESGDSEDTKLEPGTYYIKAISSNPNIGVYGLYRESGSATTKPLFSPTASGSTVSFTIPDNIQYQRLRFRVVAMGSGLDCSGTTRVILSKDQSFVDAGIFEPFVGGQPSPSPDYPQTIQTVTGLQTVTITGKNLFDKATITTGAYLTIDGGIAQTTDFDTADYIAISPSTTYYLPKTSTRRLKYYDADKVALTNDWDIASGTTGQAITTPSGAYYVRFSFDNRTTDINTFQFELGSTPTTYAPYSKTDYPISLGTIELCKLGTYQDYIYKDGEDWKVHRAISKYVFETASGTGANWDASLHRVYFTVNYQNAHGITFAEYTDTTTQAPLLADKFKALSFDDLYANGKSGIALSSTKTLSTRNNSWTDETTARNEIVGTTMYYALATATDTVITDTDLITQLEAIRTASLENGTNTISNSTLTPNLAGDMEVGYYGYNPRSRYDKFIWLDLNNNYEQIGE